MQITTLHDLLMVKLQKLYSIEDQLVMAIPKLADAASDKKLKEALMEHLEVTQQQRDRLTSLGTELGIIMAEKTDEVMRKLIEESQELIQKISDPVVRDAAIMGGTAKVEHYEMAAYHAAHTLANKLELDDVAEVLDDSHGEEKQAAMKIEGMAEAGIVGKIKEALA